MNPNCMKVRVTGYLNDIRICLALLFDIALERYHSRQSRTNLREAFVHDNRARMSPREVDIEAIRNAGLLDCVGNKLERFKVDIFKERLTEA